MSALELYAHQDSLTDPGDLVGLYSNLPSSPPLLREVASNLIAHVAWLSIYGISVCDSITRETQPIATRLEAIQALCSQPLTTPRPTDRRSFGTCRDYALLLCSMLRHHGIAARVRCGFATYLTADGYEDHWICEYWLPQEHRWLRADAQLDALLRAHLKISFDPSDVPNASFVTSDQAWRMARSGDAADDDFGHGEAKGLWFLSVNVHRDLLALTNRYISDWDSWRNATARSKVLDPADLVAVDQLASAIEESRTEGDHMCRLKDLAAKNLTPPWRR